MHTLTRALLVSVLFLACVGCDQVTKAIARDHLVLGDPHSFVGDAFRLTLAENPGAFLSIGESLPDHVRSTLFIVGVGIASLGALWAAFFAQGLSPWSVVGLSLIASGGAGNWIDRLTNDGRVTDFLNVGVGGLRTGIFNVADMVLMAGVAIFIFTAASRRGQPE
jgi:signal peptidase II